MDEEEIIFGKEKDQERKTKGNIQKLEKVLA